MNITVTGSRYIEDVDNIKIIRILKKYVGKGHKWFVGGAMGVDNISLVYLLSQKECVTVIVPFRVCDQPFHCRKNIYKASRIIEMKQTKDKMAYKYILRNNKMVDTNCKLVLAFKKGETNGTNACIEYAEKKGIKVLKNYL